MNNPSKWLDVVPTELHPAAVAVSFGDYDLVDTAHRERLARTCGLLPSSLIEALGRDPAPRVRCSIAARLQRPPELFYRLVNDETDLVAYALLGNSHVPSDAVHTLFTRRVLHTNYPKFFEAPFEHLLVNLVRHPALPLDDLVACPALTVLTMAPAALGRLALDGSGDLVKTMSGLVGSDASVTLHAALELASLTLAQPM